MTSPPRQQHQQPVAIDDDDDDDDDDGDDGSPPGYVDHVTTGNAGSLLTPSLIGCMTAPPPYQPRSTATQPSGLATHKHTSTHRSNGNFPVEPRVCRLPSLISFPPVPQSSLRVGPEHPFPSFFPLVHSLPHLLLFFTFSLFPFLFHFTYFLLSIPSLFFYHNRPTPLTGRLS